VIQHLPNLITIGRLLAVPVVVLLILEGELFWAFWLFAAAGVSDAVDGFIARTWRARSYLGGYLDPLADKTLLVSIFLALAKAGFLPNWLVILVVSRDIMIVGGVLLLYTLKVPLAMQPLFVSKVNTLMQIVLAATVLGVLGLDIETAMPVLPVLVWLTAATTTASGASYLVQGWSLLSRSSESLDRNGG